MALISDIYLQKEKALIPSLIIKVNSGFYKKRRNAFLHPGAHTEL